MKIVYIINVDWFFISHRLPIALEALKKGHDVYVFTKDTGKMEYLKSLGIRVCPINLERGSVNPVQSLKLLLDLISLLLLLPLSQGVFQLNSLALIWGISIIGFSLALQAKTLNLASDATDVAMAIFSGLYNVGIGGGALLGGLVTAHIGLHSIGWVGAILASLGFLISLYLIQRPDFLGKKAP